MPVFRVERNKGYTVMSNHHLRDKSLSLKAKGLLSQILSLPEDWDYTLSGLCYINRESKDASPAAVFICYIDCIKFTGSARPQLQCARRTLPGRPYHR